MSQEQLRPGDEGYLGHRAGPGAAKAWRPQSLRNRKQYMRVADNRRNWPLWRDAAGIHGNMTMGGAYKKLRTGGKPIHWLTLIHIVNGLTDCKLSTAIDISERLGCDLNGFTHAMQEAWERTQRRIQAEEAIREARGEIPIDNLDPRA
jgi:hypothetical protein